MEREPMTLLELLRGATAASHDALDGLFGALNLADRQDFERFLMAHAIGMDALEGIAAPFLQQELECDVPDYAAMLHADLAALGVDAGRLPRIAAEPGLEPAAVAYVLTGSRLGLSVLRKQGYWQDEQASLYMEDKAGIDVWRALLAWLARPVPGPDESAALSRSAVRCFDIFRDAFEQSCAAMARTA